MRTQVNNDRIFEVESGEALWFELKRKNSNVHLYNNLKLFLGKDCTAEYDAIAHIRHETIPCVAVLMEAKDSVHPSDIKELITKTETLSKYITYSARTPLIWAIFFGPFGGHTGTLVHFT